MIREALEHFQITPNLTENIMREISRLKPAAPSGGKPLVPWAIGVSTLAVVLLMLGIGNQHLSRFQKPYSFDAASEMTVEIIEAPIVVNLESKPDVRTQLGGAAAPSQNEGAGQHPDDVLFAAAQADGKDVSVPKQEWIQADTARSSTEIINLFATSEGELYAVAKRGRIYKLPADGKRWRHIFDMNSLNVAWGGQTPIAKSDDTLYLLPSNEFYASGNDGETWDLVHSWQIEYGYPTGLVLTDQAFYVAFDNGIFRSEDTGKTWKMIADDVMGYISSLRVIQNMLFAGTDTGLYRFNVDSWQRLEFPVPRIGEIISFTDSKDRLYVVAALDRNIQDPRKGSQEQQRTWWIFRSADLGDSWRDITPTNAWHINGSPPHIKLVAVDETLLAMERGMVRSTDGGNTWMKPPPRGTLPPLIEISPALALNESTIYASGNRGLYRSTNNGKSWDLVNIDGESRVDDLIVFNEGRDTSATLYARTGEEIVKTTDYGHSWKTVGVDVPITAFYREEPPRIFEIVATGDVLYAKGNTSNDETRMYKVMSKVSTDDNTLMPVQGMPPFQSTVLRTLSLNWQDIPDKDLNLQTESFIKQLQENSSGATQFFKQLVQDRRLWPGIFIEGGLRGASAISENTFYMEYNFKLFRWKSGETQWFDTGVEETTELSERTLMTGFKLAVLGNTVYVGKRDGTLVQSFDAGDNWSNVTLNLPFRIRAFKEIVFADSTVYVATDAGITASDDGKPWRVVTDSEGTNLVMEQLAVDGNTLYGVNETGIHRLENSIWNQIISEIPDDIISLAVDGNTVYIGTKNQGMLYFSFNE